MLSRVHLQPWRVTTIFFIQLVIVGCAGIMPSVTPPRVNIIDLRVLEVKPLETAFSVDLRVINPNDFALNIKGLECDLELNDRTFGSGVSGDPVTIPAYGTDVMSIIVYSSMIDIVRGFLKLSEQTQLTYKINGALRLSTANAPAVKVPFESKGEIDLKGK